MTQNNGRIPMQFPTQNRLPKVGRLSPEIKVSKHLGVRQTEEVVKAVYDQYPDLIEAIRQKLALQDEQKHDEFLGEEMMYIQNISNQLKLSFDIERYAIGKVLLEIVQNESCKAQLI